MGYGVPLPANPAGVAESSRDAALRIAYIGTLAAHKGAHLLLAAVARLFDLALRVDVYGDLADTDYRHRLQRAAAVNSRVRLRGRFASDDMPRVLAGADVLVIPSLLDENTPLVLLQAIAHRCPVLVSDVVGLVEPMRLELDGLDLPPQRCRRSRGCAAAIVRRSRVPRPGPIDPRDRPLGGRPGPALRALG